MLWGSWHNGGWPHYFENKQCPESNKGPLLPRAVNLFGRISVWLWLLGAKLKPLPLSLALTPSSHPPLQTPIIVYISTSRYRHFLSFWAHNDPPGDLQPQLPRHNWWWEPAASPEAANDDSSGCSRKTRHSWAMVGGSSGVETANYSTNQLEQPVV